MKIERQREEDKKLASCLPIIDAMKVQCYDVDVDVCPV